MKTFDDEVEVADPIAHPHYPARPLHAAHPVYTVVSEPVQDDEGNDLSADGR